MQKRSEPLRPAIKGVRSIFTAGMVSLAILAGTATAEASRDASIVIDAKTGKVLYSSDADGKCFPASLTKMMTLYLLFEAIDSGKTSLNGRIKISSRAAGQAPSKLGLKAGQTIAVKDAILALVTKSANDIAVAIAEHVAGSEQAFAQRMTSKARQLGMSKTTFRNASGLPNPGQVTTARDMATLGRALQDHYPKYYAYFATRSFAYGGRRIANHNKLLGRVAGVNGIKTGYTRASGFNLVTSVNRNKRQIVAVVLGGNTGRARDQRMVSLIETYLPKASTGKRTAALMPGGPGNPVGEPLTIAELATAPAPQPKPIVVAAVDASDPMPPIPEPPPTDRKTKVISHDTPAVTASIVGANSTFAAEALDEGEGDSDDESIELIPIEQPKVVGGVPGGWKIQLAATPTETAAKAILAKASKAAGKMLASAEPYTESVVKNETTLYRARFAGFDKDSARAACDYLVERDFSCLALSE